MIELIEGIAADNLLGDKAYDTNEIIEFAELNGMKFVAPPKSNRKSPSDFDKDLYKYRHMIENRFLKLKRWRGIATRYLKNANSFLAAGHIRWIALWLQIS